MYSGARRKSPHTQNANEMKIILCMSFVVCTRALASIRRTFRLCCASYSYLLIIIIIGMCTAVCDGFDCEWIVSSLMGWLRAETTITTTTTNITRFPSSKSRHSERYSVQMCTGTRYTSRSEPRADMHVFVVKWRQRRPTKIIVSILF